MDHSKLRLRTFLLVALTVFCIATLLPSFTAKGTLPGWFHSLFSKQINLGLDLQGGKHIVYNIALDKAVDDKASEIKRDLDAQFADEKITATVKTPRTPLGGVDVLLDNAADKQKV